MFSDPESKVGQEKKYMIFLEFPDIRSMKKFFELYQKALSVFRNQPFKMNSTGSNKKL